MDEVKQEKLPYEWFTSKTLETMCRACLSINDQMQMKMLNLQHFSECTSIMVTEFDGLPRQLCEDCSKSIDKFYEFRQLCLHSQKILQNSINKENHLEEIKKEEFEDSQNFDSNVLPDGSDYSDDQKDESIGECLQNPIEKKGAVKILKKKHPSKHQMVKKSKRLKAFLLNIDAPEKCEKQMKKYKKNKHSLKKNRQKALAEAESETKLSKIKCPQCDRFFLKQSTLDNHLREHSGLPELIFPCKICEKVLKSKYSFDIHMGNHLQGKQYKCSICDKSLSRKGALVMHERIHSGSKKFICQFCGKGFMQIGGFKAHLLRHTGERPYACDRCDKRFTQPRDLREHLVRHNGIKNFSCRQCPQTFFSKKLLTAHLWTHTDVKHSCDICGKTFKSKSFIVIHKRTHTGERPYECDICSNKFMAKADLRHHRMIHTGEKPNKCKICSQAFIQKSALNTHMKGHKKLLAANDELDDSSKLENPTAT